MSLRRWIVTVRVPGAEGSKTSSEKYLVEAETPSAASDEVNSYLADGDLVGGDVADVVSIKETTLQTLVPFKQKK